MNAIALKFQRPILVSKLKVTTKLKASIRISNFNLRANFIVDLPLSATDITDQSYLNSDLPTINPKMI